MLLIIRKKVTPKELKKVAEDLDGYIKVVVDVERQILAAGGKRHVDGEQTLLTDGSHQKDLWGGGVDMATHEIDYNSIINLRLSQDNPSREILPKEIRIVFYKIVKMLLL